MGDSTYSPNKCSVALDSVAQPTFQPPPHAEAQLCVGQSTVLPISQSPPNTSCASVFPSLCSCFTIFRCPFLLPHTSQSPTTLQCSPSTVSPFCHCTSYVLLFRAVVLKLGCTIRNIDRVLKKTLTPESHPSDFYIIGLKSNPCIGISKNSPVIVRHSQY